LFRLTFALGAVASALLVALIVHGLAEDRRSDMAVLLALGASLARVGGSVLLHGAAIVAAGCGLGTAGAVALAVGLDRWAPILPIAFTAADVARVVGTFAAASLVATAASVLRLRHVDPMEAFRS
jgi:ABC-type lipoprotein release transport system permease subunit